MKPQVCKAPRFCLRHQSKAMLPSIMIPRWVANNNANNLPIGPTDVEVQPSHQATITYSHWPDYAINNAVSTRRPIIIRSHRGGAGPYLSHGEDRTGRTFKRLEYLSPDIGMAVGGFEGRFNVQTYIGDETGSYGHCSRTKDGQRA